MRLANKSGVSATRSVSACSRILWRAGRILFCLEPRTVVADPRARCRSLGFRPRLWAHTSDLSSKLAGIGDLAFRTRPERRYLYQLPAAASHLGVEVEHGSPEGIQRPFGSFRDGLRSLSRLLTLSRHRAVRRVRSSAAAPRATLPEPATFRREIVRAPHTRNRSMVHHDDGHHDDPRGDLPDGESGLGQ